MWSSYERVPNYDNSATDQSLKDNHTESLFRYVCPGVATRSIWWFFATVVLAGILLIENLYLFSKIKVEVDDYEHGFATELDAAKPAIKLHRKRFSNALHVDTNGTLFPVFNDQEPRYVGPPSPDIDQAWDSLLSGRYIRLFADEVAALNQDFSLPPLEKLPAHVAHNSTSHSGTNNQIPMEGYYGGPDMLHTLHCVNAIRQHIDFEYYRDHMWLPPQYQRMHIDHCIDQLRQAALCHGDMTPVTLKAVWLDKSRWAILGQTERLHTCRDGEALRRWVVNRGDEHGKIMGRG